ncbi:MAG: ribosome silencing factor [Alphaproteobacteria bacterium]
MLRAVIRSLEDDKAVDVVTIDLNGKSTIADHMVIASGRSHRQVSAMADHLIGTLKDLGLGRVGVEGQAQADWVLVDAGDVIVHLFRPEIRSFYNLEKMWGMDMPKPAVASASH